MNVEELQAALGRWDSPRSEDIIRRQRGSDDVDLFVEAARMWANPNIEAGAKARYEEYEKDAASYKDNHPWSWEDLPAGPKAKFRHDAKVTVAAALTPGDTQ